MASSCTDELPQKRQRLQQDVVIEGYISDEKGLMSECDTCKSVEASCTCQNPSPLSSEASPTHDGTVETSEQEGSLNMELRQKTKGLNTVSLFAGTGASTWNQFADKCYDAFKIKRYLVEPNYILCVTKDPAPKRYYPTVDEIISAVNQMGKSTSFKFPSWERSREKVQEMLPAYNFSGCDQIPYKLRSQEETVANMRKLQDIVNYLSADSSDTDDQSSLYELWNFMDSFCEDVIEAAKKDAMYEHLYKGYVLSLVNHFIRIVNLPVSINEANESIYLDLSDTGTEGVNVMDVRPDILMKFNRVFFLVGEVKRFNCKHTKKLDNHKSHRASSERREHKNPDKDYSSLQSCTSTGINLPPPDDVAALIPQVMDSHTVAGDEPLSESNYPYRKLCEVEKNPIDGILPQLIAEMLGCMYKNENEVNAVRFSRLHERVQYGLAINAFQVRFVRFVMYDSSQKCRPRVSEIRNAKIQCNVFITRELNLFKSADIISFFKILHSLIFVYSRNCAKLNKK